MKDNSVTIYDLVDGNILEVDGILCKVQLQEDESCNGCIFDSKYGCKTSAKCHKFLENYIFTEVKDNE